MSTYVNIQTKWLTEWRLTPSEALVYGYLYGWLVEQRTIPFRQTQAEMARALGFKERTFKGVLGSLIGKGCVEIVRSATAAYRLNDGVLYNVESANIAQSAKSAQSANIAHQKCKSRTSQSAKSALSTYNNTYNNTINNTLDETRVRTRTNIKNESEAMSVKELVEERQKELADNSQWSEKAMLYHHITRNQLADYLNHFADKLEADGVQTKTRGDFLRHFNNWLRIQLEQQTKKNNSNGTTNNVPGTSISRDYVEQQLAILATAGQ